MNLFKAMTGVLVAAALILPGTPAATADETRPQCPPGAYYNSNSNTCHQTYRDYGPPTGSAPCNGGSISSEPNDKRWGFFPWGEGFIVWIATFYWCHYVDSDSWEFLEHLSACDTTGGCDAGWFVLEKYCRDGGGYRRCDGESAAAGPSAQSGLYASPLAVHPPYLGLRQEPYPSDICWGAQANVDGESENFSQANLKTNAQVSFCSTLEPLDGVVQTLDQLLAISIPA